VKGGHADMLDVHSKDLLITGLVLCHITAVCFSLLSFRSYTYIAGCLQLLEILEIYWNLKTLLEILEISWNLIGPPGSVCVRCR